MRNYTVKDSRLKNLVIISKGNKVLNKVMVNERGILEVNSIVSGRLVRGVNWTKCLQAPRCQSMQ